MGNKFIVMVPQQQAFVVEYLGSYQKTLQPGLNILLPYIQKIAYQHSLKEQSFEIKAQNAITRDNVYVQIDGVLYLKVQDPYKCSYGSKEPIKYTYTLAQSIMRSEIGKLTLDKTFEERDSINKQILENLQIATSEWGIQCLRYEIKDIKMSDSIRKIMNLQAESERKKRADILISEGKKQEQINQAFAEKQGKILMAEARAQQTYLQGEAVADRIDRLHRVMESSGDEAFKFKISERYLLSLKGLSDKQKNIIIQANINDPKGIIQQSLEILNESKENLEEINIQKDQKNQNDVVNVNYTNESNNDQQIKKNSQKE